MNEEKEFVKGCFYLASGEKDVKPKYESGISELITA
jgi:hypothetical protein